MGLVVLPRGIRVDALVGMGRRVVPMGDLSPVAAPGVERSAPVAAVLVDRFREAAHLDALGIDPDDHVLAVIVHPQQGIAREEDPVGFDDLPGTPPAPRDRAQVPAFGIEDADLDGLLVQHVDVAVAGGLDAPDVGKSEVAVGSIAAAEAEVHLRYGDFGAHLVDGGEVRVAHQDRAVGECLAGGVAGGRFGDAGGNGDGEDEEERCAGHGGRLLAERGSGAVSRRRVETR